MSGHPVRMNPISTEPLGLFVVQLTTGQSWKLPELSALP